MTAAAHHMPDNSRSVKPTGTADRAAFRDLFVSLGNPSPSSFDDMQRTVAADLGLAASAEPWRPSKAADRRLVDAGKTATQAFDHYWQAAFSPEDRQKRVAALMIELTAPQEA